MEVNETQVFQHSTTVKWREYLKSVVIEPGIALNETAAAIFMRIDGKRTVADIAREIAGEFEVDAATCHSDVCELIAELADKGYVVAAQAGGS